MYHLVWQWFIAVKVEHMRAEYLHEGVLFTKQTKLLIYLLFLPY